MINITTFSSYTYTTCFPSEMQALSNKINENSRSRFKSGTL